MKNYTVWLKDWRYERKKFLEAKFFLEMCGYIIFDGEKEVDVDLIITPSLNEKENTSAVLINLHSTSWLESLCKIIAQDKEDLEVLLRILSCDNLENYLQDWYVIYYVYSKIKIYRGTQENIFLMKKAVLHLHKYCEKIKKLADEKNTWREVYAFTYLAITLNKGMYNTRGFAYADSERLENYFCRIYSYSSALGIFLKSKCLLYEPAFWKKEDILKECETSSNLGIQYHALSTLGALYEYQASNEYNKIYDDDGDILMQYHQKDYAYYEKAYSIQPDLRSTFSLALQNERIVYYMQNHFKKIFIPTWTEKQKQTKHIQETNKYYLEVISYITSIPKEQMTYMDFLYLYCTYAKLAAFYAILGNKYKANVFLEKLKDILEHKKNIISNFFDTDSEELVHFFERQQDVDIVLLSLNREILK